MSLDALSDFVATLDNLPSEVHHILQEIGHKEARHWDFRNRAASRDHAVQKHAKPVAAGGQGLLTPNPKEEATILKTRADFEKAEQTAREKLALSERGVTLLDRHLTRLANQLEHLTPNVPPPPTLPSFAPVIQAPPPTAYNQSFSTPTALAPYQNSYSVNSYGMGTGATSGAMGMGTPGSYAYGTAGSDKRKIAPPTPPIQVPLLPAQSHSVPPHHGHQNQAYGYQNGTPLASAASRQPRPSRLSNVYPQAPLPHQNAGHMQQQQQQHIQQQQERLQAQQHQAQRAALQAAQNQQMQAAHLAQQTPTHSSVSSSSHSQKRKRADEPDEEAGDGEGDGDGTAKMARRRDDADDDTPVAKKVKSTSGDEDFKRDRGIRKVYTDVFDEWIPGWKRRGWRNAKGDPVANRDLIEYILALLKCRKSKSPTSRITFEKVRAHSGIDGNEEADRLANQGAEMGAVKERNYEAETKALLAQLAKKGSKVVDGDLYDVDIGEELLLTDEELQWMEESQDFD
ncbi:ribonuclease HI, partial [Phenoliferia sp. Uapishka_3]